MRLELDGILLRPFETGDAESMARNADNPKIAAQLRDRFPNPYTESDARRWIAHVSEQTPVTCFAIDDGGEVVGGIGLDVQQDVHCRTAELGYWLAESHWGRGIATRVVRAFTESAFEAFGLIRIYASVFEGNDASARVLEKAGFQLEGRLRMSVVKHGRVLDQLMYSRLEPERTRRRPRG